ncbi:Squalene synthase [Micractinium conductrix]|uniref:Squalene synthase n=1 Tax=Micractinium conductrix TaxID=554055 RepID=A0A2P6VLS3_9CHLO|nr:Squalene synthase [Micractinium conductrix]|eukprot:PSC75034.1 Squalene synthase [Micractinium conductrix]
MGKLGELLKRPDELVPMVSMALAARRAKQLPKEPGLAFCYDMLNRVSRSFAVVIQQLPEGLRDAICVFYLVLRALDTVEDDMALDAKIKVPLLRCFHEKSYDRSWSMTGCGSGEYVRLMEKYPLVTDVFLRLDSQYQQVIADICRRMGEGMAKFVEKADEEGESVESVADYDLYCHYVAGLVGIGLSQLFASSGLESPEFAKLEGTANEMGLLLQKTNIIRDYLEDINEEPRPRMWWPREVWGQYAGSLEAFKQPEEAGAAMRCLNHMITDALRHVPACLDYMSRLREPAVFRFCAIPQIMAIATLSLCYKNHKVFTGVVKMRRGEVARIMFHLSDFADVCVLFRNHAGALGEAAQQATGDPNQKKTVELCRRIIADCDKRLQAVAEAKKAEVAAARAAPVPFAARVLVLLLGGLYLFYAHRLDQVRAWLGIQEQPDAAALDSFNRLIAIMFCCYALWIAVTGRRM